MTARPVAHGRDHGHGGADPVRITWEDVGSGSGGGGPGVTRQVRVPILETPDVSGGAYPSLTTSNGFTNVRRLLPYYSATVDAAWTGSVRIPQDYGSGAELVVTAVVNAAAGAVRWVAATAAVPAGSSEDTAYTTETAQDVTVPAVALRRFDTTFVLSTVPVAGADLNVKLTRNATHANDTCAVAAGVWAIAFQYQTA